MENAEISVLSVKKIKCNLSQKKLQNNLQLMMSNCVTFGHKVSKLFHCFG